MRLYGRATRGRGNKMQVATLAKNARDIFRAGAFPLNASLLRAELSCNHRVSDRRFLAEMLPKHGTGAEIGVFTGLFSTILLEIAQPKQAYFVDPWWQAFGPHYPDWGHYTDRGRLPTAVAHEAALRRITSRAKGALLEVLVEFSTAFFARMPDQFFDWVYLDSTHSYDETVAELGLVRSKLKPGAILAGDDWQDDPNHQHYGVAKAVLEATSRGEFELLPRLSAHQWAVRPIAQWHGESP